MATLTNVSANMRLKAEQTGEAKRELRHGLKLILSRSDGQEKGQTVWRMRMSRETTTPSSKEEETIRREFGIPDSASRIQVGLEIRLLWLSLIAPLAPVA